ncbi:MAG: response regulator [Anaerolineales bacterium]|nr:response regulator [Anaerolineales bacterium]
MESVYGIGSTFMVTLPLRPLKTAVDEPYEEQPLPLDRPTALVVDDDAAVRDLLSRWLTREGFHIRTAANGREGIRLARKLHPQVITLDVMMPDVDGWHVLSTLKTDPATADIPVVMMTIVEDRQHGYALGAADYLTKPIDREQLVQVLYRYTVPLKSNTILVVEDDDATREIMQRTLARQGWLVETAENGRLALKKIAQQLPTLIILDLMMPEMDGFEFIDRFRQNYSEHNIPIIVLTAKDLTPRERTLLRDSVKVVMQKGVYRHDDLLAEIRRLLAVARA